jgi:hypothetical protein
MSLEFDYKASTFNTKYAPLAALLVHYQQNQVLSSLSQVDIKMKTRDFTPVSKLEQVLISILAGCQYLVEVNSKLKPEQALAQVWGLPRFADQATLASTLDALTQKNSEQIQEAVTKHWQKYGRVTEHDWRGFLWLEFDLSGLPCGKQGQKATRGYFSGKKTSLDGSWPGSVV